MHSNTLTLALTGSQALDDNVRIEDFADAIVNLSRLIEALSDDLDAKRGVTWVIDALEKSSAIATIRGESEAPEKVTRVIQGYTKVGRALQIGAVVPFSPSVVRHATALTQILNGYVTSIRFETAEDDIIISRERPRISPIVVRPAYGAIEGRIQTLTNRKTLRFTLYDALHDRAVSCYLGEGQEGIMREAWDKRALVEGLITRDPISGRPISIRNISKIHILTERGGNYLDARGIVRVPDGTPLPEEIIRRLRDG